MFIAKSPAFSASKSALLFGGIILVLLFAKVLLIPLAFALALCFLLLPAVSFLERRGISRNLSVGVMSIVTCGCVAAGSYLVSRQVLLVAQELPRYSQHIQEEIGQVQSPSMAAMKVAVETVEDYVGFFSPETSKAEEAVTPVRVVGERSQNLRSTGQFVLSVADSLGQLGIILIFTIYMLIYRDELRHRLLLLAGLGQINSMTKAMGDATSRISKYLVLQIQVNAGYGLLFGVGLHLLAVPYALLWGVLAGMLRIIPFVGSFAATLMPLLMSVAVSRNLVHPAMVLLFFLMLELFVGNVVEPRLFRSRIGISELALLASAIFWSMLWGWPGLILATPLTVCVVVIGRYVPQLSFLHSMMGSNAKLTPAAHMYERLLAMDQTAALGVAERFLDGKPLGDLYDVVVIPVLSMSEEDKHKGALTAVQSKFIRLTTTELIARLTEYEPRLPGAEERSARSVILEARRAELHRKFAVVCISAGDKADELATVMLTQLLENEGHATILLSASSLSNEILQALAGEKETVVFISALPPFAFARTRALCHRVRGLMPENRMAIALWNIDEDPEEVLARFGAARPDTVVGTLADATSQVKVWQQA